MKLQIIGCSHHTSKIEVRERLAFSADQAHLALAQLREQFPRIESVLLSTCNRVELYLAAEEPEHCPTHHDVVDFLARFHGVDPLDIFPELIERTGEDAVRHLFTVAASLDSMVVGEAQILAQVKQAYEIASSVASTGPLTNLVFQAALKVAKRVATETRINQRRVSIPSVAVADFAKQVFQRFDDKQVLVIGAGEMGEETLRYLIDEGATQVVILNRNPQRAQSLAERYRGRAESWERLYEMITQADIVISTTGSAHPIVSRDQYLLIEQQRAQRPLFILDLAVPRDFDPQISHCLSAYLYSIDDLRSTCQRNRKEREKEWPKAEQIIEEETARFMAEWYHRATGPTIARLKARADEIMEEELLRLLQKLTLDDRSRKEVRRSFERLVNKLLHPPLESLRDQSQQGPPHGLLDALKKLFQLQD